MSRCRPMTSCSFPQAAQQILDENLYYDVAPSAPLDAAPIYSGQALFDLKSEIWDSWRTIPWPALPGRIVGVIACLQQQSRNKGIGIEVRAFLFSWWPCDF